MKDDANQVLRMIILLPVPMMAAVVVRHQIEDVQHNHIIAVEQLITLDNLDDEIVMPMMMVVVVVDVDVKYLHWLLALFAWH